MFFGKWGGGGGGGEGARYFKPKLKYSNESVTAIINSEWIFLEVVIARPVNVRH